jgi:hypothetical protein
MIGTVSLHPEKARETDLLMARRTVRSIRPMLESAEARVYLSGAAGRAAILPASGLINLRTAALTSDLRTALLQTTPQSGREGWSLNLLKVSPSTRTVYGALTLRYNVNALPSLLKVYGLHVKVTVNIAFATSLDAPKPSDVNVEVSENVTGFGPNVRRTMAEGVVQFLETNHNAIAANIAS